MCVRARACTGALLNYAPFKQMLVWIQFNALVVSAGSSRKLQTDINILKNSKSELSKYEMRSLLQAGVGVTSLYRFKERLRDHITRS